MEWKGSSVLLLAVCSLHAAVLQRFEAVEPHMGTLFRITAYAGTEADAQTAFRAAFDRVAELDEILSDYQPGSELNRLCRGAVDSPVAVSPELFTVLEASLRLAEASGGAFDITLGPVIRLWREARQTHRFPSPEALAAARARTGWRNITLDAGSRTVRLRIPGMQLDVGGIAKGYAADEALLVLRQRGIASALVAASGDLALGDAPPDKPGWTVGLDSLDSPGAPFARVLTLHNAAVSTSGDTEQFAEIAGRRYSHIIDPATGLGLTNRISVSVVAARGIDADGLSTAVRVLGRERGFLLLDTRSDAAALLVTPEGQFESAHFGRIALHHH